MRLVRLAGPNRVRLSKDLDCMDLIALHRCRMLMLLLLRHGYFSVVTGEGELSKENRFCERLKSELQIV